MFKSFVYKLLILNVEHAAFNAKYSFLYKGYAVNDPEKAHYAYLWETVVSTRKVILMFVLVYFGQDPHLQSLVGLLVISVVLFVHTHALPFENRTLNAAEFLSLLCSTITFYLGQFTYNNDVTDSTIDTVSVLALGFNILFLLVMFGLIVRSAAQERQQKSHLNDSEIASDAPEMGAIELSKIGKAPALPFEQAPNIDDAPTNQRHFRAATTIDSPELVDPHQLVDAELQTVTEGETSIDWKHDEFAASDALADGKSKKKKRKEETREPLGNALGCIVF